jgi:putative serine protease PepD
MTDAPQDPHSGTENGTPDATSNPAENSETREQTEARLNSASAAPQDAPPTAPYAPPASPTQPLDRDYAWTPAAPVDTKRSNRVGIVAALAVGALVGGVSGAGVAAWAVSANQGNNSSSAVSNSAPQNITVNDTSSVNNITAVAAKAAPSVVTISVTSKTAAGTGSGVVLSKDGYVLTNTHVVTLDGAISNPAVQVTTSDGHLFSATVVGTDPIADLAVIKLKDPTGLTPAEFGDSSKLNVGETAIAIGARLVGRPEHGRRPQHTQLRQPLRLLAVRQRPGPGRLPEPVHHCLRDDLPSGDPDGCRDQPR